ncbi:hypothetical protein [Micromonospora cathayae]|uniref:Uncharacterized protein n=1 Tax=Micromonospora cathayae TaxID=3028804 RepID=A0ABY7ZKZ4_9ACTN|nr:hypothetical protein [Micromonospora sp. HUAS 3]WDZ83631.1 hypothetical protein PVK37_24670 [Micromonospora sp. HUAS 3]
MTEVTDEVLAAVAAQVGPLVPVLAARIPRGPATTLGRLGAPDDERHRAPGGPVRPEVARRPSGPLPPHSVSPPAARPVSRPAALPAQPDALAALHGLGSLLAERLLGALELSVTDLVPSGPPALEAHLPPGPAGQQFAWVSTGQDSAARTMSELYERLRPGVTGLLVSLVRRLTEHPSIRPSLDGVPGVGDEATIAARHGAVHLALAVATAALVVDPRHTPAAVDREAAVVGLGTGVAALLLRETPMPPGYAAARLARIRAEYLLPRESSGSVRVSGHRFGLVEGELAGHRGPGVGLRPGRRDGHAPQRPDPALAGRLPATRARPGPRRRRRRVRGLPAGGLGGTGHPAGGAPTDRSARTPAAR